MSDIKLLSSFTRLPFFPQMNMKVCTIRQVTPEDAKEWRRLRIEALRNEPFAFAMPPEKVEAKTEEDIRADISAWPESGVFVIGAFSEENLLLGMVGFSQNLSVKLRHRGHIWGVYVTPSARRSGLSKRMFEAIISTAQEMSEIVQLDIEAVTSNTPSIELYKSIGFRKVGIQPRALKVGDKYLDEHLFVLDL